VTTMPVSNRGGGVCDAPDCVCARAGRARRRLTAMMATVCPSCINYSKIRIATEQFNRNGASSGPVHGRACCIGRACRCTGRVRPCCKSWTDNLTRMNAHAPVCKRSRASGARNVGDRSAAARSLQLCATHGMESRYARREIARARVDRRSS
jgi:hypothetical protein